MGGQPGPGLARRRQGVGREAQLAPVTAGEAQVAEVERVVALLLEPVECPHVARRLGHLLAREQQVVAVHPHGHHRVAEGPLALGDLVLVMGEGQVDPPRVDVEALPEVGDRHGRALDVPPGVALAPGAVEADDPPRAGRLPEDEVGGVALVVVDGREPVARPELVERVAGQPPVVRERRDVVVDGAGVDIGVAPVEEPADEVDHLGDVGRGPGVDLGGDDPEPAGVAVEGGLVLGGDLLRAEALVGRGEQHLVLTPVVDLVGHVADVSDVHHLPHRKARPGQRPADEVAEQERAEVADVDGPVHGGAAGVHRHGPRCQRPDRLDRTGQRVVEAQHRRLYHITAGDPPGKRSRHSSRRRATSPFTVRGIRARIELRAGRFSTTWTGISALR